MLEWISDNSELINVFANLGMLGIWAFYLQMLWSSFSRDRRPRLLITRGMRSSLEARCLVTNMSRDTIFIRSIIVVLETRGGELRYPVTEIEEIEDTGDAGDIKQQTRQGPIESGAMRDLGSFAAIVTHVLDYAGPDDPPGPHNGWDGLKAFTIYVIGIYGPDEISIGARRSYDIIEDDGGIKLSPRTIDAVQIRSRKERREIDRMLREDL
ncbi:hypothetical protein [Aurantimonas sp. 22II-16-19i]|uniref:hypothetical protein n=1 Tax=Aurantimonas sp. 22II-16-19i TaxID=1317114 RepID=UPI0009F7B80B|nr:hypothetical protein [Aurantimonas sp. 22II-16-19i]ORE88131.1 hypothetical protein ATO4_24636 [Aurantimonas sp. 22II-16-19i]